MKRSDFIKSVSLLTVAAAAGKSFAISENNTEEKVIFPPALKIGDTIGIISPAGVLKEGQSEKSIKNLEDLGFIVVQGENVNSVNGYFAGSDKDRANDVNKMFANSDVKGIFCTRGGYGAVRILDFLDYQTIKKNPKVLVGYSDITSLQYGIFKETGLVTFHGPVGISTFNEFSVNALNGVVINNGEDFLIKADLSQADDPEFEAYTVVPGKAEGRLVGGNLSVVASLIGTKHDINYKNKIVYLEEIGEEPYSIDRMLTQMLYSGKFEEANGVALGIFKDSTPDEKKSGISNSFTLKEVILDRLSNLKIPVYYGFSFGHILNKYTVPFGVKAELNASEGYLKLLERAVI
ncbi:MAG: LD-carboxypeptidase [Ignavibacteriaceae bacterium]|nr:LD-carboxypeptidase [Ignavibacteriaceae bacterium]